MGEARKKVPFDVDKRRWHPSVLLGQIVLVSTVDDDGEPNVAPKSWVSVAAFQGPIIGFGCTTRHATARNILDTREFVLNVPDAGLADPIFAMVSTRGTERIRRAGLTLAPATEVAPPIVAECRAHLECRLDSCTGWGEEVFLFGRVVAATIDEACLGGSAADRYRVLDPALFLEHGTYAGLGPPRTGRG